MRVSIDFNHSRQSLVIYMGEIKDIKLPAGETLFFFTVLCHKVSKVYGNL